MRVGASLTLLIPSTLILAASVAWGARRRRRWIDDVPVGAAGAGLGLGALMFQQDVSVTAWWLAPLVVGALAVLHVRVMFAGDGPLRV